MRGRRQHPRLCQTALAALLAVALAPTVAGPATAAPPAAPDGFYGVALDTSAGEAELDRIAATGVGVIRIPVAWQGVQRDAPGERPLSDVLERYRELDRVVERASLNGTRVSPVLYFTPGWLDPDPTRPPLWSTRARQAWRDFLREIVGRYGTNGSFWALYRLEHPLADVVPVTDWQVWNEPNAPAYVTPSRSSPELYAELLKLSAETIRAADDRARIVTGGMFGTPYEGVKAHRFLRRLYRVPRIERYFDVVALHPYSADLRGIKVQVRRAKRVMRRAGDGATPIWLTELGWPTKGDNMPWLRTDEAGQSRMLRRSLRLILRKRRSWGIRHVTWFKWRDKPASDCYIASALCVGAGLLHSDGSAKPAFAGFRRFALAH